MHFENVFENKRVFITGHTGFKGSWLASWLTLLGADVTGYALPPEHGEEAHFRLLGLASRIRHIEADIRNAECLNTALSDAEPEFIFHLAAQPLVRRSYVEPKVTFDTNVGGSVNLLEAVRRTPSVRVLLYITSDKCYGHVPKPGGYRETDPLGSGDPYSASKACAELVFSSYQSSFFQHKNGFAAASVRAGNVIGGGDWSEDRIVPDSIRALRADQPILVRNPHAIRPWQHVLEALGGYLLIASLLYTRGREFEGAWNFGPGSGSPPSGRRAGLRRDRPLGQRQHDHSRWCGAPVHRSAGSVSQLRQGAPATGLAPGLELYGSPGAHRASGTANMIAGRKRRR